MRSIKYIILFLTLLAVSLLAYGWGNHRIEPSTAAPLICFALIVILFAVLFIRRALKGQTLLVSDLGLQEEILLVEVWQVASHYRAVIDRRHGGQCQWITIRQHEVDETPRKAGHYLALGGKLVSID